MSIDYCPVLKPTTEEFSDFMGYIRKQEKIYAHQFGIIKVKLYMKNHNIH